jgi:hypothetical protein
LEGCPLPNSERQVHDDRNTNVVPVEILKLWSISVRDPGKSMSLFIAAYPLSVWPTKNAGRLAVRYVMRNAFLTIVCPTAVNNTIVKCAATFHLLEKRT